MAEKVPMTALSPTMEDGHIVKWIKQEGDSVATGEVLCEVETDKATMEYESTFEGTLLKIVVPEGENASVGQTIAVVGEKGEDVSDMLQEEPSEPSKGEKAQARKEEPEEAGEEEPLEEVAQKQVHEPEHPRQPAQEQSEMEKVAAGPPSEAAKVKSSPLARKMAAEHGIDMENIEGTGPDGRVVEADVKKAIEKGSAKAAVRPAAEQPEFMDKTEDVSQKRQLIAKRMSESKFSAPHYYLKVAVNMDSLLSSREKLNARSEQKISLNAVLIKIIAQTLTRHPLVNATWNGDTITRHGRVDIGVAVAQPDGLVAPVVRNCEARAIPQIDAELRELIRKARSGGLSSGSYSNPTFTISNLGAMGIEEFTAIINPPASAILAIGQITPTPVVHEGDQLDIASVMKLTLSCDHRIIDGAVGATFLSDLKDSLENPLLAMC